MDAGAYWFPPDASFAVLERPFLVLSVSGSVKGHGVR